MFGAKYRLGKKIHIISLKSALSSSTSAKREGYTCDEEKVFQ